jgi:hypothetical protein
MVKIFVTVALGFLLFGWSKSSMPQQDLRSAVLNQLRREHSDTSKPHGFDFYFYFPTKTAARQAGQRLTQSGYRVEVQPAAQGTSWLCLAKTTLTPDTAPLTEMGTLFSQLAQEFHGEFDGWETDVIKR